MRMDSGPEVLNEDQSILKEGIGLILFGWPDLQLAIGNGNRKSHGKAERMISSVFDYFTQTKDPIDSNGLEVILARSLFELNTVVENDDSLEDVIKELLDLCEQCFDGNYQTVRELRETTSQKSVSVVKVSNCNDEGDEESDEEDEDTCMHNDQTTEMMVDTFDHCSKWKPEAMSVDEPEADDGWTVVPCRKNKGKRN